MVVFALKTEDVKEVRQWVKETVERSKETDLIKNPLKWKFQLVKSGGALIMVCDVQPLIFCYPIMGWLIAIIVASVWGFNQVFWISVSLGLTSFFWTAEFFYRMTRLALRKNAKYAGRIDRVKLSDVIKEVVF